MVDEFIGKKVTIGFGKETARGTAVVAGLRVPKGNFTRDEKVNTIEDESSIGIIEDSFESHITKKWAEGTIEMNVYANAIGFLLLATFGTISTSGSDPYTHTFTVANTNVHQSLTLNYNDDIQDKYFPLCVVDTMDLVATPDDFVKVAFNMKSKAPTDQTLSPSFVADYPLLAKHLDVKFATNLAGLSGASVVCIKNLSLNISKNVEEDFCLGDVEPENFHNKMFTVEGEFEVDFQDESYLDFVIGSTKKAMEIEMEDTSVDLGGGVRPTLTFTLAKVAFKEIARAQANEEIVKATLTFKALYSLTDTQMITAVLINDKTSY